MKLWDHSMGRRRNCASSGSAVRKTKPRFSQFYLAEPLEGRVLLSVTLIKDLYPGQTFAEPTSFVHVGSTTYFVAGSGGSSGRPDDLWKTDGTAAGTSIVAPNMGAARDLVNFNGTLYFFAENGGTNFALWKSDGTQNGTVVVDDGLKLPGELTVVGTKLFFTSEDVTGQTNLFVTDGVGAAKMIFQTGMGGNAVTELANINGVLYFSGDDGTHGPEPYITTGSTPTMLGDLSPGAFGSFPFGFISYKGFVYFDANDNTHGDELWRTNGTPGGTVLFDDVRPGANSSEPENLTICDNQLFFTADTDASGNELWVTDGTNTHIVSDINPGLNPSDPQFLTALNNKLLFQADDGTHGPELFIWDAAAGTMSMVDINPGATGSSPNGLTKSGNVVYFNADDGTHGGELWQSDGTVAGTVLTADINPGSGSSFANSFTDVNGTTYFAATDGVGFDELWKVSNIPEPAGFQAVENQLFNGVAGTFTDPNPTRVPSNFTATIEWGDGATSAGTITQPGGAGTPFDVSGTHTYAEEGAYPVVLLVHNNVTNTNSLGDVNVSRMLNSQSEPTIAIDPTNPSHLFAASNAAGGNGIFAAVSTDGGINWSTRLLGNGSDGIPLAFCDPQAKFDSFGNLFLTYLETDAKSVVVALSTDGGDTFTTAGQFTSANDPNGFDQPSIAVGPGTGGTGNTIWCAFKSPADVIQAAGATVTGKGMVSAFSTPESSPGSGVGNFGDISVGPQGQVLITWQDNTGGSGGFSTIFTNVDEDGVGPKPFDPAVPVTRTNVVGQYSVPPQAERNIDAEANLAWDLSGGPHQGRVYLCYTDSAGSLSPDTNIFVVHSDDGGDTWSSPVRVNDDSGGATQFLPAIAIDQTTGDVGISWYDTRNDPNGHSYQAFAAISSDGGVTFSPNVQVSTGATNTATAADFFGTANQAGDYSFAAFFNGAFHPIWVDNSTLLAGNPDPPNLDIATNTIGIAQVADASLSASGATVTPTQFVPFTGVVASFTDANSSATLDDFTATINWGDGQTSAGTIAAVNGGGFGVTGTNRYAVSGAKSVAVTIFDHGASAAATTTANVIPTILPKLTAPEVSQATASETFTVTYTDSVAVKASTIGTGNLIVTAPDGTVLHPVSATVDNTTDGTPRTGTYVVDAPNGTWSSADDGLYSVSMLDGQVSNINGHFAPPGPIGNFKVDVVTSAGDFGTGKGKKNKLTFTAPSGGTVSLTLTGGTGQAFTDPVSGQVDLQITGTGGGAVLTLKVHGRVTLGNVDVTGSLKSFAAPANLAGTLFATGSIGKLTLGSVTGTIAAAGSIASLTAASLSGAMVLSGANLGADGQLGGGDDTFSPASIAAVKITGGISTSIIAAGIAPGADGVFGTSDDASAGGGSAIKSLSAHSVDSASLFEADSFGKSIRIPKPIRVSADGRFKVI